MKTIIGKKILKLNKGINNNKINFPTQFFTQRNFYSQITKTKFNQTNFSSNIIKNSTRKFHFTPKHFKKIQLNELNPSYLLLGIGIALSLYVSSFSPHIPKINFKSFI